MNNGEYTHCSHGKSYTEECDRCESVWVNEVVLLVSAQRAADFALAHPGLIERNVAESIAHLNRAVAILAKELQSKKATRERK